MLSREEEKGPGRQTLEGQSTSILTQFVQSENGHARSLCSFWRNSAGPPALAIIEYLDCND